MTITPTPANADDPASFGRVSTWINSAVYGSVPADVYVVRIDNWFGDRWLSFAGKIHGAVGTRFHDEGITLPPFHPRRVLGQRHFRRYDSLGDYVRMPRSRSLHPYQTSEANLNRTLSSMFGDVLLAWYGGGTDGHDHASLMVYRRTPAGNASPWYASFDRCRGWSPDRVIGLGDLERDALESYVDDAPAPT